MLENKTVRALCSGLILAAVATFCTAGVLLAEHDSAPFIERNRAQTEQNLINKLLPGIEQKAQGKITYQCKLISDKRIGKNMKAYIAQDENGQHLGYIMTYSTNRGYSNPLVLIGGTDPAGNISKIDVFFTRETPGIGDKVERRRGNYMDQFDGKNLLDSNWDVKKFGGDFDYITGATVTSRAVVLATKDFLEVLATTDMSTLRDCPR